MWWSALPVLLFVPPSQSQDVVAKGDGVEATMLLPIPEERVRALLADPIQVSSLTPDILSVSVEEQGECKLLAVETRGPLRPLEYRSLYCPTPDGWRETLLESSDFERMESEWHLEPAGADLTRVVYRAVTRVSLPVPEFLVRLNLERAARETLCSLAERLGTAPVPSTSGDGSDAQTRSR